jgi:hypothetical protein
MVAALHAGRLAERDDRQAVALGAPVVNRRNVVSLIERGSLDGESALAGGVDERKCD